MNTITTGVGHFFRPKDRVIVGEEEYVVLSTTEVEVFLISRDALEWNQLFEAIFQTLVGVAGFIALVIATAWWLQ